MTDGYRKKLEEIGVDVSTALNRFMNNESIYERFMKKFPDDQNFEGLVSAVGEGDAERAFIAAHTLKGVAGNLGLDCITEPLCPVVEKLRSGNIDGVGEAVSEIKNTYNALCSIIREEG